MFYYRLLTKKQFNGLHLSPDSSYASNEGETQYVVCTTSRVAVGNDIDEDGVRSLIEEWQLDIPWLP